MTKYLILKKLKEGKPYPDMHVALFPMWVFVLFI